MEIKRNVKDSIFTHLFKIPKYRRELYLELHPEETDISEEDIKLRTIENIWTNGVYNDLGLLVKDKFIVLIEAQSSWSPNILVRMLVYLAETYKQLWITNHYNIYGTKKIRLPKPEFYVVYTGDKEIDIETLSMNEEYFENESEDFELRVHVIQENKNDNVEIGLKKSQHKNKRCAIIDEYITFTKIYDEERRKTEDKKEAIIKTIGRCIKQNILKEYLQDNKKEVISIMDLLYDQDFITECWKKELIDDAKAEGMQEMLKKLVEAGLIKKEDAEKQLALIK